MNIGCYNGIDDYTVAGHDGYWKVSEVVREDSKWWNKPDTTFYLYNESGEKLMTTTPPIPVRKYRTKEYITTMKDHISKCCGNVWGDVLEDELVISGNRQTGKTTAVKEIMQQLKNSNVKVYLGTDDTIVPFYVEHLIDIGTILLNDFWLDKNRGISHKGQTVVVISDDYHNEGVSLYVTLNHLVHTGASKIIPIKIWTPR
jgi:Cdc6-like AAA superfamily ATPase